MVMAATATVTASLVTPLDEYNKRLGEIDAALNNGKITKNEAKRAELIAIQQLRQALPDMSLKRTAGGAMVFGTAAERSARLGGEEKESLRTEKDILKAAVEHNRLLGQAVEKLGETGDVAHFF